MANSGYSFVNWTEGALSVSTNSNYSFVINYNRNLVANFDIVPPPTPPGEVQFSVWDNPFSVFNPGIGSGVNFGLISLNTCSGADCDISYQVENITVLVFNENGIKFLVDINSFDIQFELDFNSSFSQTTLLHEIIMVDESSNVTVISSPFAIVNGSYSTTITWSGLGANAGAKRIFLVRAYGYTGAANISILGSSTVTIFNVVF